MVQLFALDNDVIISSGASAKLQNGAPTPTNPSI